MPRVVSIIDPYKVVLNVGSQDEIEEDAVFIVFKEDEEIFDTETGESLGRLEIVRGKGRVIHVQEKMCTLESIEKGAVKRVIRRSKNSLAAFAMLGATETEEYEPSDVPFDGAEIGDRARRIK